MLSRLHAIPFINFHVYLFELPLIYTLCLRPKLFLKHEIFPISPAPKINLKKLLIHNIKEWERGGGGKQVYDCGKFEIVDFINFVQCKGNCLLLRSEHYLERHIGRTQYFRINSY